MNYLKPNTKLMVVCCIVAFLFACKTEPSQKGTATQKTDANVVNIRIASEPDVLNPTLTYSTFSTQINSNIFLPLLSIDPKTLKMTPTLVNDNPFIEEIKSGEYKGGITYTYEIRKEAVWDDGKPVLASDYIFTLKSLFNPALTARSGIAIRGSINMIKDVKVDVDNPKKFTVYTDVKFITGEANTGNVIVIPEHIYDANGLLKKATLRDFTNKEKAETLKEDPQFKEFDKLFQSPQFTRETVVGCGPYRFESWETGQRIVLKKKENWWGDALAKENPILSAYPKELIYLPIADENGALIALKAEDVDVIHGISPDNYFTLQQEAPFLEKYSLGTAPTLNWSYININNNNPKVNDKKTRRALAHLIDYEELIEVVFNGLAQRIVTGPIHPSKDHYHKGLKLIDLNLEKAKQLLAETGWKDSDNNGILDKKINGKQEDFSIDLIYPNKKIYEGMASLFQKQFRKAGIQLTFSPVEFNEMRKRMAKKDFELSILVHGGLPLLDDFYQAWHTQSRGNNSGFGNTESDALIEEIRQTLDKEKRDKLYLKIQEILYEEQPVIFLTNNLGRFVVNNRFKNTAPSLLTPGYHPRYYQLK